jgi:serine protease Do
VRGRDLLLLLALAGPVAAQDSPPAPAAGGWTAPAVAKRAFPSVVKVYGAGGFQGVPAYGTGVIVDERGFVLTAWSIALRTDQLKVVTADGRRFRAQVWRGDPGLGVALLRLQAPPEGLPSLVPLRLSAAVVAPGDGVLAIGNPFGIIYGDELPAVADGVVTAVGPLAGGARVVRLPERLGRVIITDIPTNPGSQGGPLLDLDGRLVGIVGRLVESRATNTILDYAVPTADLVDFVRGGVRSERPLPEPPDLPPRPPQHAAVDAGLRLLRVQLARSPMAYVDAVVRGSPAEKAGLQPDDLVFRIDERTIRSCRDYDEVLAAHAPGDRVAVIVKRGDTMRRVELVLAPGAEGGQ